ncbi:hypothetical protein Y032_0120g950 [Ancylostoma ceylanicum]|uniref:Zinc finger, C2H2 type n=1 Tax=Ancylostoma ceylanicum TaxID=53326 RepID=A0A016TAW0_9BILA|nr:hypothetical protein Y032_0120g950 [Ancylostoma ceylanicum]
MPRFEFDKGTCQKQMPGPVTCKFCDRLYSRHSLPLHEPKCQENPSARRQSIPEAGNRTPKSIRPRTRSMSRPAGVEFRVCFVCGQRFDPTDITQHERHCLAEWKRDYDRLKRRFESRAPEQLLIPSVDGTQDSRRLNEHAEAQAAKAQMLRCRRCSTKVPLRKADAHNCSRLDPPVEFFF